MKTPSLFHPLRKADGSRFKRCRPGSCRLWRHQKVPVLKRDSCPRPMVKSLYCLYFILEIWSYGIRILIPFADEKRTKHRPVPRLFFMLPSFCSKKGRKNMTEKVLFFLKFFRFHAFSNLKVCFLKYFMNL